MRKSTFQPVMWLATVVAVACTDRLPTTAASATELHPNLARTSAPRYKLRFVYGIDANGDGEIRSGWFPDTGLILNTKDPWKAITVGGVTIDLVNYTHGSWSGGTCATFRTSATINETNWDISGTDPLLSFAGTWSGTVAISQNGGTTFSFDGDRVVAGVLTPSAGGIHNLVTNANAATETKDLAGDWFQLEIRNAAMKFGSASSPDGVFNPAGAEVACGNLTVLAEKASLISPK